MSSAGLATTDLINSTNEALRSDLSGVLSIISLPKQKAALAGELREFYQTAEVINNLGRI